MFSGYAPTTKRWISTLLQASGIQFSPIRLSIAGGILRRRFEDRYGYAPRPYSVFVGGEGVELYECFDHDIDIVLEAIFGSNIDRATLLRMRSSSREAAAAA
jgi:hypothetical protein